VAQGTIDTENLVLASSLQATSYWLLSDLGGSGEVTAVTDDTNVTLQGVVPLTNAPDERPYHKFVLAYDDEEAFVKKQAAYNDGRMLVRPHVYDRCRAATMARVRQGQPNRDARSQRSDGR
jgi:hypothetical protein